MSFNQSRSEKNDTQYRKSARSGSSGNQQRNFSGRGGGSGGGTAPPPASSLSSNRSFKKTNNAQGGNVPKANISTLNSESSNVPTPQHSVQNGAHVQPPLHGASDAPFPGIAAKATESSATQKSNRAVTKAPLSQSATMSSGTAAPITPAKAPGDASRAFSLQFGSISPGHMNVMQIPARTSSAPPNLDEQKRDQARHDSLRSVPTVPIPSVPKQQFPRKDVGMVDQSNTAEAYPIPKVKKDAQVSSAPPLAQTQKPSVVPMGGMSMQMPFHQPQVPVPFGAPNPQIQSQGMAATSLQMPLQMPLSMGNTSQVQQQVFVSNLQPHPMQHQGIMHQGQSLSFTGQLGPQIPSPLGNLGIGVNPQFSQHQAGKFGGPRRTVKITHPETHEELRLDKRADTHVDVGSTGPKSHSNVPQSQPIPSFTPAHPMNYYTNAYNGNPLFFPPQSSLPMASTHVTSSPQAPRFNYTVTQGPQATSFVNPSAHNSLSSNRSGPSVHHGTTEPPNLERARDVHNFAPSGLLSGIQVSVKPAVASIGDKVADSSLPISSSAVGKGDLPNLSRPPGEAGSFNPQRDPENHSESSIQLTKPGVGVLVSTAMPVPGKQPAGRPATLSIDRAASNTSSTSSLALEGPASVLTNAEGRKKETLSRSNSIKEHQKKTGKKGHSQPQPQVGGQSTTVSRLPTQALDHNVSISSGVPETIEAKTTSAPSTTSEGMLESTSERSSITGSDTPEVFESKTVVIEDGSICEPVKIVSGGEISAHLDAVKDAGLLDERKNENVETEAQGSFKLPEAPKQDIINLEIYSEIVSPKSLEVVSYTERDPVLESTATCSEVALGATKKDQEEPMRCGAEIDKMPDNLVMSTSTGLDSAYAESPSSLVSCTSFAGDKASMPDDSLSISDGSREVSDTKSDKKLTFVPTTNLSESTLKSEGECVENIGGELVSLPVSDIKDKQAVETIRSKSTVSKAKKKLKEILQKADAAGTTSDLYMAYKGPGEKKDAATSSESTSTSIDLKQLSADANQKDVEASEKGVPTLPSKAEPDDWEDAADTPKLETSDNGELARGGLVHHGKDGNEILTKKYSRDFLLKFADQCTDLPQNFSISPDIEAMIVDRDSYPSPGRGMERPTGGSRQDRRGSVPVDDKWKVPGPVPSGRDLRLDIAYGGNIGLRPGQGGNYGVLRHPRAQAPVQYAGGILSGPMQSMGSQGGMQRNSPDADRWQRATGFQKGLFPSPQTPLQVMHRAEKKYEVGKVSDEEEAKQRQLKAILNKLTPQNFEKLFQQVKAVNIDNAGTLSGVISQIFDKALMEPTFCEMYANFCHHLAGDLPDFSEDNEKITFKRLLLNKCQEEFERGEREQEEANRVEEGEIKQSEELREEKRIQARRRMLGNIRLIGELYKKKMLTERIMHECIKKLLGQYQNPDEEDIESLCKLMSTIGEMIDHPKAKEHMDAYFDRMANLSNNMKLSSRVRFMLKDSIDLRKNKWQQRRKVDGPKKIEEVHRDAAQERHAQSSRLARGPSINASMRRGPSTDFGPRGSTMLSSPSSQMGGFRGLPSQVRGYGHQDVRSDERQSYEGRPLSVPLPQRPVGDESITLGPQGGLARGMSNRGPPSMSSAPLADVPPSPGDSRRMTSGANGYNALTERVSYGSKDQFVPRYGTERFSSMSAYDQSSGQERNMPYGSRELVNSDRSFDRPLVTSPPTRVVGPTSTQVNPSEKVWPEERLRDKSIAAIKEFYSANDEKEVALCIKDLNSPSFHPQMISLWVTDSFERKDMERDLLAKLLVNLTKSRDGMLTQVHLLKGFELVLTTLEDAVNDAPKAAEFLGRIFAKTIFENVIPLGDIGRLIYTGGEEPGSLLEIGLAADVLGSTLEIIQFEKGEVVLNEIRSSSNLRLEDFRPPGPIKSRKLEKFI